MARGSADVSEIVHHAEQNHEGVIYRFEELMKRECGVFFDHEPWSVEKHAYQLAAQLEGHKCLQTTLVLLARIYEPQRHYDDQRVARAFTARACQVTVQAAVHRGQRRRAGAFWGCLLPAKGCDLC